MSTTKNHHDQSPFPKRYDNFLPITMAQLDDNTIATEYTSHQNLQTYIPKIVNQLTNYSQIRKTNSN